MIPNDDELLEDARRGDQRAFRLLVERYEGKVAATVIGMLGRGPEADDVGQEVFVRFFRALDRFRGEASIGTYLTRIAINQSLKTLRRRQSWIKRFAPMEDFLTDNLTDGRFADRDLEQSQLVQSALARLKPDHRAVAVLRLMEGYSTKETAELLGIAEGTVMSRLSRTVKKLDSMLRTEIETS